MIVQPIGKFKLTYANGISQVKSLITQENYKSIVKPILSNIAELEPYCNIGPTVDEYLEYIKRNNLIEQESKKLKFRE